ncbi:MAG: hypothetical protein FJ090_03850 [Deltaproteobacteria bacterium]|nr:hypothetical protein [Deltaproteobacteria bacterium]
MILPWLVVGCVDPPCGERFARADNGNCYPIAEADGGVGQVVDDDTATDDSATDSVDTIDIPPPVQLFGSFAHLGPATVTTASVCFVALWDESHQSGGLPDPSLGSALATATVDCPLERETPLPFNEDLYLDQPARVGVFGGIEVDGDPGTADVASGGTTDGNFDAEPGGSYSGFEIVVY